MALKKKFKFKTIPEYKSYNKGYKEGFRDARKIVKKIYKKTI
jgi:hypothetical protein